MRKANILLLFTLVIFIPLTMTPVAQKDFNSNVPNVIIVKPEQTAQLKIDLQTNKLRYPPNSSLKILFKLNRQAYVYIYNIDSEGRVNLIFPNKYDKDNFVSSGEHTLPGKGYSLVLNKLKGIEFLQAIASQDPIPFLAKTEYQQSPFPQLSSQSTSYVQKLRTNIDERLSSDQWATDWTRYKVTNKLSQLKITSSPRKAKVFIENQLVGTTPGSFKVKPGVYEITIKKPGYGKWTKSVNVAPYETKELRAELTQQPKTKLEITTLPAGAKVFIDDQYRGITPVEIVVNSGPISLRLSKEGYEKWVKDLSLQPYSSRSLTVDLSPQATARLIVTSTPHASNIQIEGEFQGKTPRELIVPAGKLTLSLHKPGYLSWEQTITLRPGEQQQVDIHLQSKPTQTFKPHNLLDIPTLSVGGNLGVVSANNWSAGVEFGAEHFLMGVAIRTTGDDINDKLYIIEDKTWENGIIHNYGPELEPYGVYLAPSPLPVSIRLGVGLALQYTVSLAPLPRNNSSITTSGIEPRRRAYLTLDSDITFQVGVAFPHQSVSPYLVYHSHRGIVAGFNIDF